MHQNADTLSFSLCGCSFLGRGFVGVGRAALPHMSVGRGPIGPVSPIPVPFSLPSATSVSEEAPIPPGTPPKVEVKIETVKYVFSFSSLLSCL